MPARADPEDMALRSAIESFYAPPAKTSATAGGKPATPTTPKRFPLNWPVLAKRGNPPDRRWCVNGWVGFGHVTLLVGSGGIGKSLLAQQLASCVALGRAFIGQVDGPLRVLAWHAEDDHDELWRRQTAIARWLDVQLPDFADNLILEPRAGCDNVLVTSEYGRPMATSLLSELSAQANDYHAEVVILDNAAQLFGGNENDRHAVTLFLNALVGALPGRAILLLAHPARSVGSEFSGSSAWENTARTRLYLGAKLPGDKTDEGEEPVDDVRFLSRRKANYSDRDYRRFQFLDGVLVPDTVEMGSGGVIAHARAARAKSVVLAGIRTLASKGVHCTASTASPSYLPKVLLEYRLAEDCTKRDLSEAMRSLILAGEIEVGVVGRYQNRSPMKGLKIKE